MNTMTTYNDDMIPNTLLYTALSNLTAPIFQVTFHGKLVTTAFVSVLLLNSKYNLRQWICLVILSVGVAIVVLGEQHSQSQQSQAQSTTTTTTSTTTPPQPPSSAIVGKSYFHGFTIWVWILVALQAGGGLLVAAVIKYADNVLKGLATAVSVVFATLCSMVLFQPQITSQFLSGAILILLSDYYFSNLLTTFYHSNSNTKGALLPK